MHKIAFSLLFLFCSGVPGLANAIYLGGGIAPFEGTFFTGRMNDKRQIEWVQSLWPDVLVMNEGGSWTLECRDGQRAKIELLETDDGNNRKKRTVKLCEKESPLMRDLKISPNGSQYLVEGRSDLVFILRFGPGFEDRHGLELLVKRPGSTFRNEYLLVSGYSGLRL